MNNLKFRIKNTEQDTAEFIKQHTKEIISTLTPHIHAEIIHAFADGHVIEVQHYDGDWRVSNFPSFLDTMEYRVKPAIHERVFPTTSQTATQLCDYYWKITPDKKLDKTLVDFANHVIKQHILDTESK